MRRLLPLLLLAGLGLGLGGCAVYDRPAGYYRSGSGYGYNDGYRYRRYPPPRYYRQYGYNQYGYRQYGDRQYGYSRSPYGW